MIEMDVKSKNKRSLLLLFYYKKKNCTEFRVLEKDNIETTFTGVLNGFLITKMRKRSKICWN